MTDAMPRLTQFAKIGSSADNFSVGELAPFSQTAWPGGRRRSQRVSHLTFDFKYLKFLPWMK